MAPGKGFEPLRARSPPAILPFFRLSPLLFDLEAGAITTPPPRLQPKHLQLWLKEFSLETQDNLVQFLHGARKNVNLQKPWSVCHDLPLYHSGDHYSRNQIFIMRIETKISSQRHIGHSI